ncbi:NusG domain II-containing protein [Clostridium lundense]|uniref:NusG domain II-containing protein n=1 Tax=Clostridium lundense TaxID=319475 RepID=UPI0004805A03|nr:NusG domain II-containing protein [Clostridium lundense]
MKKGDKIIFISILVIITLGFAGTFVYKNYMKSHDKIALIKQDGKVIDKINLTNFTGTKEMTIKTNDGHFNKILIEKDKISITDADCPDRVCVKTGPISQPGDTVVCLPHKLMITIEGTKEKGEIDATAY